MTDKEKEMLDLLKKIHQLGGINREIDGKCWKLIDNFLKNK